MNYPYRSFPAFLLVGIVASGVVQLVCAAAASAENTEHDYSALLSVRSAGSIHVTKLASVANESLSRPSARIKEESQREDLHEVPNSHGAHEPVPGVVFVKMIKVAGELFGSMLAEYAVKRGWKTLQHKACKESDNPMGRATCACDKHYIGPDELPPSPDPDQRYNALYTHMHYAPDLLKPYMVPGAINLVIIRNPLYVLRSAHAMAAHQATVESFKNINDNFCQPIASDGDLWRSQCKFARTGQDSLLDYLDHDASEQLRDLFKQAWPSSPLHSEAMAIIDKVADRMENTFVIGLQEDFDTSMLLFESAIGWSRGDSLYMKHDPNAHRLKSLPAQQAIDSWGIGTPRGEQVLAKLRKGPYKYHEVLYERGVAAHRKQVQARLGEKAVVDAAVRTYRSQLNAFTACISKKTPENVCTLKGLAEHSNARPACAAAAIQ